MAKTVHMKNLPKLTSSLAIFLEVISTFSTPLQSKGGNYFSIERYCDSNKDRYRFPENGLQDSVFCRSHFARGISVTLVLMRSKVLLNTQTTINMLIDEGFVCVGFNGLAHIVNYHIDEFPNDKWILAPHCKLTHVHDIFCHPAVGIPYLSKQGKRLPHPEIMFSYSIQSLDSIKKDSYVLFGKIAP